MYGKGLLKGLAITLKHWFEWDQTVQYPEERPHLQERFRGNLYLEFEKCIACGTCVKVCPNDVLSFVDARSEETNKKVLMEYTIDHQYCMYCNLCVENCPANCLHFNHDFELTQFNRENIKSVYQRPPELAVKIKAPPAADNDGSDKGIDEEQARKDKQIKALWTALEKNPVKVFSRYVENEEQAGLLAEIVKEDETKAERLLKLMVEDKEKAEKVARAFVNKEMKKREGGNI